MEFSSKSAVAAFCGFVYTHLQRLYPGPSVPGAGLLAPAGSEGLSGDSVGAARGRQADFNCFPFQ